MRFENWFALLGLLLFANGSSIMECSFSGVINAFNSGGDYIANCSVATTVSLPAVPILYSNSNLTIDGNGKLTLFSLTYFTIYQDGSGLSLALKNLSLIGIGITATGSNRVVLQHCKIQAVSVTDAVFNIYSDGYLTLSDSVISSSTGSPALFYNEGSFDCYASTITSYNLPVVITDYAVMATSNASTTFTFCTVTGFETALQGTDFDITASIIFGDIKSILIGSFSISGAFSVFSMGDPKSSTLQQFGVDPATVLDYDTWSNMTGFGLQACSPAINSVGYIVGVNLTARALQGAPDAGAVESNYRPCPRYNNATQFTGQILKADVTLSGPSILPVQAYFNIRDGSAVNGVDYSVSNTSGFVTITFDERVANLFIPLPSQPIKSSNKTFYIDWSLRGVDSLTENQTTTCYIINNGYIPCEFVQCADQTCAANPLLCPPPVCSTSLGMFTCSDGNCVASPRECILQDCPTAVCWDGSCRSPLGKCPVVPSCPYLMKRCGDGSCRDSCPFQDYCFPGEISCPDGSCKISATDCGAFNGCPIGKFKCFDGSCVSNSDECLCDESNYFKCFDGSCQQQCPQTPVLLKPLEVSHYFTASGAIDFDIVADDSERTFLGSISAEVELTGENYLTFFVDGVPDSISRNASLPKNSKLASTAIGLTSDSSTSDSILGNITIALAIDSSLAAKGVENFCIASFSDGGWECVQSEGLAISPRKNQTVVEGSVQRASDYSVLFTDSSSDNGQSSSEGGSNRTVVIASVVVVCIAVAVVGAFFAYITWRKKREQQSEELALRTKLSSNSSASQY
eukprot:TRINITY_DN4328_c0_g1_i2.p1 TRINITY_DN4328_c0_g1~~TRINITY_DN4328_c0_g1_i2.p1  ORF type:complete len:829 (-),score=59.97 TRINITY_DN4328_c0_g1_i2:1-2403(-)